MTIIALLLILILIALVFGGDAVVSLFQILMKIVLFGIFAVIFMFFVGIIFV